MTTIFTPPILDAAHFQSGQAQQGALLTADGHGGCGWPQPTANLSTAPILPFLGDHGGWNYAVISAAYESVTGAPPTIGAIALILETSKGQNYIVIFTVNAWIYFVADGIYNI